MMPLPIPGFILAGGKSRRMDGQEKCFLKLAGRSLLDIVIGRVGPQVSPLILNAAGDPARFAKYNMAVVGDVIEGFKGPLAGILTAMEWSAANMPEAKYVATFPCDTPFIPNDLVARLQGAMDRENAAVALASSKGRVHPVCALWSIEMRDSLRAAIVNEGLCRMGEWTARQNPVQVDYGVDPVDPFFNVNTPQDLAEASAYFSQDTLDKKDF